MTRGMSAVAALDPQSFADTGALLKKAGMTLVSTVGGASGPLYGTLFLRLGAFLGPDKELSVQNLAQAFKAGLDGIMTRGKAEPGDKTMVDALAPAVKALQTDAEAGRTLQEALDHAAQAAAQGRDATVGMIARRGRASYLGEGAQMSQVGIVIVSHSHKLATAAVDLVAQMVSEETRPPVRVAAGLDETTLGTDAAAVSAAIEELSECPGILVLVDLGSAILSAQMALDFVDPELAAKVTISPAPLVEGLFAALITASTGAPLEAVASEAANALSPKQSQLAD